MNDGMNLCAAASSGLPPTELLYYTYEGNFVLECEATVLECCSSAVAVEDDGATTKTTEGVIADGSAADAATDSSDTAFIPRQAVVKLDRTILHPQGGGQPTDTGVIMTLDPRDDRPSHNEEFRVDQVTIERSTGIVTHTGQFIRLTGTDAQLSSTSTLSSSLPRGFQVGDRVLVQVDEAPRILLSECHTAGHVVDAALASCQLYFPSLKAYHYLEGSYVEYRGTILPKERDGTLKKLQDAFQQLVEQDIATEIHVLDVDEADQLCNNNASSPVFLDVKPFQDPITNKVRVVTVAGYSCPCGGTHVRSTGLLKKNGWCITSLKCKKDVIRVKYGYSDASIVAATTTTMAGESTNGAV